MPRRKKSIPTTNISRERDPVTAYARDVVSRRIIAGPYVRGSCKRHLADLKSGKARGLKWSLEAMRRALDFFPDICRLAGGQFEGRPFTLEPSQAFIVGSMFGWIWASSGLRRFRKCYIEEGKGNGKSPLAAGIGLYCLCADGEMRAEVYAAASKRDQAQVLFRDAVAMVDQSPALRKRILKSGRNPVWNLLHRLSSSFFRPISSEDGQSGPRPHCALCDEVHEHRNGDVIEHLERGFKWRRQPIMVLLTNSGTDKSTVCYQEHTHAVRVALGEVEDDRYFSYVCGLDEGDDPLEDSKRGRASWLKANPLLDVTISRDDLAAWVRDAKQIPGKRNGILRLNFCVWTDAEQLWMARETLEACMADFEIAEHEGNDLYVGVDLSSSQDLTAEAFVAPTGFVEVEREGPEGSRIKVLAPTFDAWCEAWTPGDTVKQRAVRDNAHYEQWIDEGFLHAPKGKVIRLDYPAARLAEYSLSHRIRKVAYDRYAFRRFEEECEELGLTLDFIEHPQGGRRRAKLPEQLLLAAPGDKDQKPLGCWMPGSLLELEQLILEKRIRFKRNPVLISAMMSAVTESDPFANRWLSKRRAVNRIDLAVAMCMAIGAMIVAQAPERDISAMIA
jgi:phage terminase large subunit-like protein